MALPTTAISISAVKTALSSISYDLGTLCRDSNVNPWSRYKPGYLKADATADKFVERVTPRGASYTDPRGNNVDSGTPLEVFRLGDFRGYNHSADAPYLSEPGATIEFGSGTSTSFGISLTAYVKEVNWAADSGDEYRERHGWADLTHIHVLDASDDSIIDSAVIPAIGGSVSLDLDGVAMSQGVPVTKTYHLAFGVDTTHWSVKLGTRYGADGISDVTVLRLEEAEVVGATFIDTSFGGGANDPYSSVQIVGTENYAITGTDTATFRFTTLDAFRCYHSGGSDYYKNIAATWWVKGFHENPATEYEYKNGNIASNNAVNTVDLGGTWVDTPPHISWEDGDKIILILRDLTINF